jgi:hypothetical protein
VTIPSTIEIPAAAFNVLNTDISTVSKKFDDYRFAGA